MFCKGSDPCLPSFNFAPIGDIDDKKSTSDYVFMMGAWAISWSFKKQPIMTLSIIEAELVVITSYVSQAIWLKKLFKVLYLNKKGHIIMHFDNMSIIKLVKNLIFHGRSKHNDVHYHFLHNLYKEKVINMVHCQSEDQITQVSRV